MKTCKRCGATFEPSAKQRGRTRLFCSNRCTSKYHQGLNLIRVRARVYRQYGGICACCSESRRVFLTIDHVNNDGANERKKHIIGIMLYYRALKEPSRYQILCRNCNWAKRFGLCPHKA